MIFTVNNPDIYQRNDVFPMINIRGLFEVKDGYYDETFSRYKEPKVDNVLKRLRDPKFMNKSPCFSPWCGKE